MIPICLIALILLIWFRTDAWLEYTTLFKLNMISHYKDYCLKYKEDVSLKYLHYLRRDHNCFFVRLITCPICFATWLGIILGILFNIFMIPIYIICGLLIYCIIDKLLE